MYMSFFSPFLESVPTPDLSVIRHDLQPAYHDNLQRMRVGGVARGRHIIVVRNGTYILLYTR